MKRSLVICEPETDYALRLTEFMNKRKNYPLRASAFDSFELAADHMAKNRTDVLLLSERFLNEKVNELNVKQIIILTEDENSDIEDYKKVYKYFPGDTILREVESAYDAEMRTDKCRPKRPDSGKVYCIYSPVGGCGKTSFSLAFGQELAKDNRVLYLNLESCSALESILGVENDRNISDLIYYARQNPENIPLRLPEMTVSLQNLDCIMPVPSLDDISFIKGKEWIELLEGISGEGRYDVILIEPESGLQGFSEILEYSEKIFVPYRGDPVSMAKTERFEKMLGEHARGDITEKIVKVKLPFFNAAGLGRNYYESLLWSELGDHVRQLVRKEGAV